MKRVTEGKSREVTMQFNDCREWIDKADAMG